MKIRILTYLTLLLFSITACHFGEGNESKLLSHKEIPNFSDLHYTNDSTTPYFHHIEKLPYEITLGDFRDLNSILFLNEFELCL